MSVLWSTTTADSGSDLLKTILMAVFAAAVFIPQRRK